MKISRDTHYRSILKTISWRICATVTTMLIFLALTHNSLLALEAGGIEVVAKLILYYIHERAWIASNVGRNEHPLASLPVNGPINETQMQEIKDNLAALGHISTN